MSTFLDEISWNSEGLIAAIAVDASSGELLMQAWVNREALTTAIEEQRAVYWSRSRNKLWRKGEESGQIQELVDVYLDCDNDALCYKVNQIGDAACHTGRRSCFHQRLVDGIWETEGDVLVDPETLYK